MIYLIILILFLIIILFLTVKNKIKALKIISISSISAGILTIIVGYIFKYIILNVTHEINLSIISNTILSKFIKNSLILISIGFLELLSTKIIKS